MGELVFSSNLGISKEKPIKTNKKLLKPMEKPKKPKKPIIPDHGALDPLE